MESQLIIPDGGSNKKRGVQFNAPFCL